VTRSFAAATSRHPLPSHAAGEVVGEILDQLRGRDPDLVAVFATAPLSGVVEDIAGAIHDMLDPTVLIGSTAAGVVGGGQELEEGPALSVWAGVLDHLPEAVRITFEQSADGHRIVGSDELDGRSGTLVLLVDPFSVPVDQLIDDLARRAPNLAVIGGLSSAGRGPGGNRLLADRRVHVDGAVGVLLGPDVSVATIVSQGCRPIGRPMTVTASDGNLLLELAGVPALDQLQTMVDELTPEDRQLAAQGLHLGRVIDEHQLDFGRGDFLIRGVRGAVRDRQAIAVGDRVEVGATVQFQVRDAVSADEDLRELLGEVEGDASLVFTCTGRGAALFGVPHHDAELVSHATGGSATAGMFCAGEIGPVGSRAFLHGYTASIALFGARSIDSDNDPTEAE
jgi:small ligand-binding sensory domain FIST